MDDDALCARSSWEVLCTLPALSWFMGHKKAGNCISQAPLPAGLCEVLPRRLEGRRRREATILLVQVVGSRSAGSGFNRIRVGRNLVPS